MESERNDTQVRADIMYLTEFFSCFWNPTSRYW